MFNRPLYYALQYSLSFFLLTGPVLAFAKNKVLVCLGQEEQAIHRGKSTGPIYNLNQVLVNKLIEANDLAVKPIYVDKICQSKVYSPSLKLLHLLITKGTGIFTVPENKNPNDPLFFQLGMAEELVIESPDILMTFLSTLQGITPIAKCLEKQIPELTTFYDRMKYLRGEIPEEKVFHDDDITNKIFSKLIYFNSFYKKCEQARLSQLKKAK